MQKGPLVFVCGKYSHSKESEGICIRKMAKHESSLTEA